MKNETNIEFLTRLMEFSPHGALTQMFVIDAVAKHAQHVATADLTNWPKYGLINPDAWKATAQHILEAFKEHGYIKEPS